MSKKHKKHQEFSAASSGLPSQSATLSHEAEYRIIKLDLIKVLILNTLYLGVILSLYFANQKSQFLDRWFARILHF